MKSLKYFILSIVGFLPVSCIVDTDLQEIPKDFMSPENSFVNKEGFESALAEIYRSIRLGMYIQTDHVTPWIMQGIGMDMNCTVGDDINGEPQFNYTVFNWSTFNKDNGNIRTFWVNCYSWIFKANVIIGRSEDPIVKWSSDEEKNRIVGEARFLRAFAYHFLANCWGDVPLVLTETNAPKFDYTRSPKQEILNQCRQDLEFAVQWMQTVDQVPGGRAPRAAAYTLLSEVYICLNDIGSAINAASAVINDPNYSLMTERFGTRANFTFNGYDYQGPQEPWGDVWWDLFQEGNMNHSEGNKEAIWNIEMDFKIPGGGNITQYGGNFGLERHLVPTYWNFADKKGVSNWLKDTLGGRPATGYALPSVYCGEQIWKYKDDWDRDMRNSIYNAQREYYWTNPNSEYYGQIMKAEHISTPATFRRLYLPSFKKFVTTVHEGIATDPASGQKHDQGRVFKDWYIMRLPETYLLRAEAYFLNGDAQKAADDINVIRNRAKASPVTASDVSLDLILDERARELYMEEFRTNTLMRMGKFVEYLQKYNGEIIRTGFKVPDYYNRFPIPQAEIEKNKEADLGQNPGY
jgi:hypothetical protein